MSSRRSVTVLFDADCGFCTRCAMALQRLDQRHLLTLLPLQQGASLLEDAPSEKQLAATLHVRDGDGQWFRGGAACLRIAAAVPLLTPLALVGRLPLVPAAIEIAYGLVARHRAQLSHLLGLENCRFEPINPPRA